MRGDWTVFLENNNISNMNVLTRAFPFRILAVNPCLTIVDESDDPSSNSLVTSERQELVNRYEGFFNCCQVAGGNTQFVVSLLTIISCRVATGVPCNERAIVRVSVHHSTPAWQHSNSKSVAFCLMHIFAMNEDAETPKVIRII